MAEHKLMYPHMTVDHFVREPLGRATVEETVDQLRQRVMIIRDENGCVIGAWRTDRHGRVVEARR